MKSPIYLHHHAEVLWGYPNTASSGLSKVSAQVVVRCFCVESNISCISAPKFRAPAKLGPTSRATPIKSSHFFNSQSSPLPFLIKSLRGSIPYRQKNKHPIQLPLNERHTTLGNANQRQKASVPSHADKKTQILRRDLRRG